MVKVLVTGMSGTGKSAALEMLGERGHRVVDTDTDQWSHWVTLADGSGDWIWREDAIARLLAGDERGHLFVSGCKTNQGTFYSQFDHIALLSAPADVLLARIAARRLGSAARGRPAARRPALGHDRAAGAPSGGRGGKLRLVRYEKPHAGYGAPARSA